MTTKSKILFIDDEDRWHIRLKGPFEDTYDIQCVFNMTAALNKIAGNSFDLILLDLNLDRRNEELHGLEYIEQLKKITDNTPIIVVTKDSQISSVVEAIQKGAVNFLSKRTFVPDEWMEVFERYMESKKIKVKYEELKIEYETLRKEKEELINKEHPFIGESKNIAEIKRTLRIVGEDPNIAVLLTGETGVGKEVAARYFHANSVRKNHPFIPVHLSAIQKTLLESTLFGHKKGAFTGAISDSKGYFRQADKGILFLDEIGDIDMDIQIKLLRFLETKLIRTVGENKDTQLDVQIIAATNKNLQKEVTEGNFRMDLYQRLKAYPVELPPLRERQEDILLILQLYMNRQNHLVVKDIKDIDHYLEMEAKQKILEYNWPGNVRELKNAVSYFFTRQRVLRKDKIDIECLPIEIQEYHVTVPKSSDERSLIVSSNNMPILTVQERSYYTELQGIETTLIATNGNKSDAVKRLGKKNLDQLRNRIKAIYKKHSQLFIHFPKICECYKIMTKA